MPNHLPAARASFCAAPQGVVADCGARGLEAFLKARLVPHDAGADLVGKLLRRDEIAQADVLRVDAEPRRRHVDQPLHDEGRDRPADAAIGAGRRLRGRDRVHAAAIMLDPVGAGQEAHHLHRFERGGPRIDRIGADIADHVGAERQHPAVASSASSASMISSKAWLVAARSSMRSLVHLTARRNCRAAAQTKISSG